MSNRFYLSALRDVGEGLFAFHSVALEMLLVKTGSTAGTMSSGVTELADFATLAEFDGAGYARQTISTSRVRTMDAATDTFRITIAAPVDFGILGPLGVGEQCIGAVIFQPGGSEATRRVVAFLDQGGFPFNPTGGTEPTILTFSDLGAFTIANPT